MSNSPSDLTGHDDQLLADSQTDGSRDDTTRDDRSHQDNKAHSEGHNEGCHLEVGFKTYPVSHLTQYGFQVDDTLPEEDPGHVFLGNLQFNANPPMEIEFRVRRNKGYFSKCTFCNLTLKQKKTLLTVLDKMSGPSVVESGLAGLSYDQLAKGNASADTVDEKEVAGPKNSVKTFAVLALGLGMLAILGLSAAFMHMQYSLSVTNAALVGNYLPINTKIDGQIAKVFFTEGDEVFKGDLLLQLANPVLESAAATGQAELDAAQAKVDALKNQIEGFHSMIDVVTGMLDLERQEEHSKLLQSQQNLQIASAEVKRFTPYVKSGVIAQVDFDESKSTELAWKADCAAKRAKIKLVELSMDAAKNNILVMGDRIDDPKSKLLAELKIAEADVKRLEVELYYTKQQAKQLDIIAPRDGEVYANYRQVGEYLRPAEEALALSFPGRTWAMGQISASQVSKVRPGQMVRVSIPSLDIKTTGIVASVGHRAVYAKGGYTADFRSGVATDVPIKVMLDDLPPNVPSGIRLDMVVKLEMGIPWLDNYLGNTPRPVVVKSIPSPAASEIASPAEVLVSETSL